MLQNSDNKKISSIIVREIVILLFYKKKKFEFIILVKKKIAVKLYVKSVLVCYRYIFRETTFLKRAPPLGWCGKEYYELFKKCDSAVAVKSLPYTYNNP